MKIVCTLLLWVAVILDSIELSLHSEPPAEITARARSRSPTLRQTFPAVLGFEFEDLARIRLNPYINPNRTFELRTYVFPPDKPIRLRTTHHVLYPMPTGKQIVLSTSNGDVCAILDKVACKRTILRAIFINFPNQPRRAKINMNSGQVRQLTAKEMAECPVTTKDLIANSYAVTRLGSPSNIPSSSATTSATRAEPPLRERSRSPTLSDSFPTVLGYNLDELPLIRLRPHNNIGCQLKFRTYVFTPHKQIGLRSRNRVLTPMPTGERIALLNSNGDICAILLKSSTNHALLRPIFTSVSGVSERVKIIMNSGEVEVMTTEENENCPVTSGESIKKRYTVLHV